MRVSVPVILSFMLLALLTGVFLPVRVRVRADGRPGDFVLRVWVKPPLWPLHISMPKFGGTTGKKVRKNPPGGAHRKASGQAAGPESGDNREGRIPTGSLRRVYEALAAARRSYPDVKEALFLILGAVTFERVRITGRAGTGDAYEAAMLCGSLNALAGIALCVARRSGARFRRKPFIRVDPVFESAHFSFSADIETSFPLARALYVSGKVSRMVMAFRRLRESSTLTSQKERGNTRSKHVRRSFLWRGTPSKA
jgi:hypothetical protein